MESLLNNIALYGGARLDVFVGEAMPATRATAAASGSFKYSWLELCTDHKAPKVIWSVVGNLRLLRVIFQTMNWKVVSHMGR